MRIEIPEPACESGYPWSQLGSFLNEASLRLLEHFMHGQTMVLCEGRRWNQETDSWDEACGGVAHGVVVYPWDFERWIDGRPVID